MQKYILLWLLLLRYMVGYSQHINYESVELIRGACPTCVTGSKLNLKECKKVKKLDLSFVDVYNDSVLLDGLQHFIALEELKLRDKKGKVKITYLPPHLKKLDCSGLGLSELPSLPNSLHELDCSRNNLCSLPALPNSLRELKCWNNQELKYISATKKIYCLVGLKNCMWTQLFINILHRC